MKARLPNDKDSGGPTIFYFHDFIVRYNLLFYGPKEEFRFFPISTKVEDIGGSLKAGAAFASSNHALRSIRQNSCAGAPPRGSVSEPLSLYCHGKGGQ
jgi:hypothetical protein